jgi:hypothetical protein
MDIEQYYILNDLRAKLFGDSRHALHDLRYMIAKTIQHSTNAYDGVVHEKLARMLIQPTGTTDATIISLNWDTETDLGVLRVSPRWLNYGFPIAPWSTPDGAPKVNHEGFQILRPHGSVGWVSCDGGHVFSALVPLTNKGFAHKDALHLWENSAAACPTCGRPVVPMFVPPLSEKLPTATIQPIKTVWQKAWEALSTCTDLVFAGYSFPPADLQFKLLVNDALRSNKRLSTIEVVTAPLFGSARVEFEDRYLTHLPQPDAGAVPKFSYETFEGWVRREYTGPDPAYWRKLTPVAAFEDSF